MKSSKSFPSKIEGSQKPETVSSKTKEVPRTKIGTLLNTAENQKESAQALTVKEAEILGNITSSLAEKTDQLNEELKCEIFPEFKNLLERLENRDYVVDSIFAGKFRDFTEKCRLKINEFIQLGNGSNLFINQIGLLALMKESARSLATAEGNGTVQTKERIAQINGKLSKKLDAMERHLKKLKIP